MTLEDINNRRMGLLQAVFAVGSSKAERFEFELDEKELCAVGYAIVHWSFLEHALLQATEGIAAELGIEVSADARQDSFRRRLVGFKSVVAQVKDERARKHLDLVADKIATENGFRQKITHGIWAYDAADPDVLHVEISRAGKGPNALLNVDKIVAFAQRVSGLAVDLLHPCGLTKEEIVSQRDGGFYISRAGLRMLIGKGPTKERGRLD